MKLIRSYLFKGCYKEKNNTKMVKKKKKIQDHYVDCATDKRKVKIITIQIVKI